MESRSFYEQQRESERIFAEQREQMRKVEIDSRAGGTNRKARRAAAAEQRRIVKRMKSKVPA